MSMTAAEIAGVVGTEYKPWWPPEITWGQAPDTSDINFGWWYGNCIKLPGSVVELAFIGAAVRELAKRGSVMLAPAVNKTKGTEGWVCLSKRNPIRGGPTTLHALVAALNESEGA